MLNLILCSMLLFANTDKMERLLDLRGTWKFELGDKQEWSQPSFDDSDWQEMFVPASWEEEGFPEYNGYAWYRKHFRIKADVDSDVLYINLGRIDDVDQAFLNGKLIGQNGSFPPHSQTAYNVEREYPVPAEYFNFNGDNVLAIRVFDDYQWGGIVGGRPGIYKSASGLDVNLAGQWLFQIGSEDEWQEENFTDYKWEPIMVPAKWENQGLNDYDGHAWYRKKFIVTGKLQGKKLLLLLGKIDDVDETFINGKKVGRTGRMGRLWRSRNEDAYNEFRVYNIPEGVLKFGRKNTLTVHVYDWGGYGGIYEGPVGIVTKERYRELLRDWEGKDKSFWNWDVFY